MTHSNTLVYYGDDSLLREVAVRHGRTDDILRLREELAAAGRTSFEVEGLKVVVIHMVDRSIG